MKINNLCSLKFNTQFKLTVFAPKWRFVQKSEEKRKIAENKNFIEYFKVQKLIKDRINFFIYLLCWRLTSFGLFVPHYTDRSVDTIKYLFMKLPGLVMQSYADLSLFALENGILKSNWTCILSDCRFHFFLFWFEFWWNCLNVNKLFE